jgi:hypothetical protein
MKSEISDSTKALIKVIVPLRRAEVLAAIKAAESHLARELSDRYRVLGAELRIDKPADPKKSPLRMVGVVIVDYSKRRNYEVFITGSGKVVRVVDLTGAQPAYTSEEIQEARKIGEQDRRVARFAKMKGSFASEFGPERAADNARRIGLRYAQVEKGRVSRVLAHAIVDLSAGKIVEFSETEAQPDTRR